MFSHAGYGLYYIVVKKQLHNKHNLFSSKQTLFPLLLIPNASPPNTAPNQMVNIRYLCFSLCASLALAGPAHAEDLVGVGVGKHLETITITADDTSPNKIFTLEHPDRLVVDIPALAGKHAVSLPDGYEGKLLKNIRLGLFNPQTSRFVFDLTQPVTIAKIRDKDNGKLVIDISAADGEAKETPREEERVTSKKSSKPIASKKSGKPVIVIDPGHGGQDPGTSGPGGSDEKDVVLEYAKALKVRLLKSGHYQVVLTRDDDEFIMLRGRVAIARKAGASLFVSLHADSAPDMAARGLSIYTVSEKASDEESEQLAARENKADVLSGMDLSEERRDVADILISLAERETKNRSATFADLLVTSLDGEVSLLSNTHRFAGFAVLKAPDVPSVLIEIGFLSHPSEEKLIRSKTYRDKVTTGIASGIDQYFALEKRLGDQ